MRMVGETVENGTVDMTDRVGWLSLGYRFDALPRRRTRSEEVETRGALDGKGTPKSGATAEGRSSPGEEGEPKFAKINSCVGWGGSGGGNGVGPRLTDRLL